MKRATDESSSPESWGSRIKEFRKQHLGLTQERFGILLGESINGDPVSAATVNRWEAGTTPRGKYWQALLTLANRKDYLRSFTGVSISDVFKARLNSKDHAPQGVLIFLEAQIDDGDNFFDVIGLIRQHGGKHKRSAVVEGPYVKRNATTGRKLITDKPLAFLLFELPNYAELVRFQEELEGMSCVLSPVCQLRFTTGIAIWEPKPNA